MTFAQETSSTEPLPGRRSWSLTAGNSCAGWRTRGSGDDLASRDRASVPPPIGKAVICCMCFPPLPYSSQSVAIPSSRPMPCSTLAEISMPPPITLPPMGLLPATPFPFPKRVRDDQHVVHMYDLSFQERATPQRQRPMVLHSLPHLLSCTSCTLIVRMLLQVSSFQSRGATFPVFKQA